MRERQLAEAQNKLIAIRHLKYRQKLAGGFATDSSDEGGVQPPTFTGYQVTTSPKPHTLPKPGTYSPSQQPVVNSSPAASGTGTFPRNQQHQQTTSSSTTTSTFQRSPLLTANAVPKPYQSDAIKSPTALVSPSILNRTYETTRVENSNLSAGKFNRTQFDAAVQDLQNKVGGHQSPLSTFRGSPTQQQQQQQYGTITTTTTSTTSNGAVPQNYEGFTTRYETRVFPTTTPTATATNPNPATTPNTSTSSTNNLMNVEQQFAKLNLENHENQVQLRQHHLHQQQQQSHQQHFRTSPLNPAAISSSSNNNGTTMVNVLDSSSSSSQQFSSSQQQQQQIITKKIHMTTSSTVKSSSSSTTNTGAGGVEWK